MKKKDEGAAAVEFALVLVPLLLLIFGMIDFGWMYYNNITIANVAHEGARASALGDSLSEVQTRVSNIMPGVVASSPSCGVVSVTKSVSFLTPLPLFVPKLGSSITIKGTGEEKCYV